MPTPTKPAVPTQFAPGSPEAQATAQITAAVEAVRVLIAARSAANPDSERLKVQLSKLDEIDSQEDLLPAEFAAIKQRAERLAKAKADAEAAALARAKAVVDAAK